jgi:alpha-D-ribose 1-methylphosphonate 5-triphosphate synthase subunit PhnH
MEPNPDHDVPGPQVDSKPTALEWSLAATLVDETYKLYLARAARPDEVEYWLQTIRNGLAPAAFVEVVKTSEKANIQLKTTSATLIDETYELYLGRAARSDEVDYWLQSIRNGLAPSAFVDVVKTSEEARSRSAAASADANT